MTSKYSISDARIALETYGHDFNLWPDQALAAFAETHEALAQERTEAAALDTALSAYDVPTPHTALTDRILNAAKTTPQSLHMERLANDNISGLTETAVPRRANRRSLSQPAFLRITAGLLACLAIGLGVSHIQSNRVQDAALIAELETDVLRQTANDLGLADVFLWVELEDTAGS